MHIDALGDDLNKFLADSKNQEENCQMLGIQKAPKNRPQPPQESYQPEPPQFQPQQHQTQYKQSFAQP